MNEFSPATAQVASQAFDIRKRYLQGQAATWIILNDQDPREQSPDGRAKAIARASIAISEENTWKSTLIQISACLKRAGRSNFEDQDRIDECVVEQLEEYARHEAYWNTCLERLLFDVEIEARAYEALMGCIVMTLDENFTQLNLDFCLARCGLGRYPLPRPRKRAASRGASWGAIKLGHGAGAVMMVLRMPYRWVRWRLRGSQS